MNVDLTPGGVSAGERVVAGGALYPRIGALQQEMPASASEVQEPQQYSHPHAANGGGAEGHQQPAPQWAADGPKRKAEPYHNVPGPAGYAAADGGAFHHVQKQQRIL